MELALVVAGLSFFGGYLTHVAVLAVRTDQARWRNRGL